MRRSINEGRENTVITTRRCNAYVSMHTLDLDLTHTIDCEHYDHTASKIIGARVDIVQRHDETARGRKRV